jgi:ribosomal protein L11 methylase PrmA
MSAVQKVAYEPGSFKDPYGSVFYFNNRVYRTLTDDAYAIFRDLSDRGVLETFISRGFLMDSRLKPVSDVVGLPASVSPSGFVIEQDKIPVLTYPYEWCFSQLKDAALKTLDFLECCLENDLMLKDATAFNLSLYNGDLRFFDVLSIEPYKENQPWMAYRQFCQQFLFPLLLASYKGMDTQFLMRGYFQDLSASHVKHYFSGFDIFKPGVLKHVTLLSMMEKSYESKEIKVKDAMKQTHFPKVLIENNVKNLRKTIAGLSYFVPKSEWSDYITECNYEDKDRDTKHNFIEAFLDSEKPKTVIDLGCNTGEYSYLASKSADVVVSADSDALSIERLYERVKTDGTQNIIPMVTNLLNPTPALGWALGERKSFFERFNGIDGFFALALVHHICISGNVPVTKCVEMLANLGKSGVVEWVDKKDEQVQKLLRNREDVFGDYTWENFEDALKQNFKILKVEETHGGNRKLCHVSAL